MYTNDAYIGERLVTAVPVMKRTDKYAVYVIAAYGATAAILGALIWATLRDSARARRELEDAEKERGR